MILRKDKSRKQHSLYIDRFDVKGKEEIIDLPGKTVYDVLFDFSGKLIILLLSDQGKEESQYVTVCEKNNFSEVIGRYNLKKSLGSCPKIVRLPKSNILILLGDNSFEMVNYEQNNLGFSEKVTVFDGISNFGPRDFEFIGDQLVVLGKTQIARLFITNKEKNNGANKKKNPMDEIPQLMISKVEVIPPKEEEKVEEQKPPIEEVEEEPIEKENDKKEEEEKEEEEEEDIDNYTNLPYDNNWMKPNS